MNQISKKIHKLTKEDLQGVNGGKTLTHISNKDLKCIMKPDTDGVASNIPSNFVLVPAALIPLSLSYIPKVGIALGIAAVGCEGNFIFKINQAIKNEKGIDIKLGLPCGLVIEPA